MAIGFAQLIADRKTAGSIRHWLNNDQVPAVTIAYEAQQELYSRLRCREMLTVYEGTMAIGAETVDLSSVLPRYRQPRAIFLSGQWTGKLDHRIPEDLEASLAYDAAAAYAILSAQPTCWTVTGSTLRWDRKPDQAYTYRFLHYQALADLDSSSNTTNFLLGRCFSAFKAACLMHGAEWLKKKDDREYWAQILGSHLTALNQEADAEQYADADLRVEAV